MGGRDQSQGPMHPDTIACVRNLAVLLKSLGEYQEAEPLYRRNLASADALFGPYHCETLRAASELGRLLHVMGRQEEATELLGNVATESEQPSLLCGIPCIPDSPFSADASNEYKDVSSVASVDVGLVR